MSKSDLPEPWLRGSLTEVPPVQRAVLHALELAREDLERWCDSLSDDEINFAPGGIAPVAFQLDFAGTLSPGMLPVVLVFTFMVLFDTVGQPIFEFYGKIPLPFRRGVVEPLTMPIIPPLTNGSP